MKDVYYFDIQDDKRWLRMINGKNDILVVLMNIVRVIGCAPFLPRPREDVDILAVDHSLKRVFITSPSQIQSFHFPFTIEEGDGHTLIASLKGIKIDAIVRDSIEQLLDTTLPFSEYREALSSHLKQNEIVEPTVDDIIYLIGTLFRLDDCYLRHDHDEENAKKHGYDLHPIDHIDFFYSNCSSIKCGLSCQKKVSFLQQMANPKTKAHHITD